MEYNLREEGFYGNMEPEQITEMYGSPVYVYNEKTLRLRCRELKKMVKYPHFVIDYSIKANFNPALLQIVKEEGLEVDVMSPGEISLAKMAGYEADEIFYICNNVSEQEMRYAIEAGVTTSVDSLSQLEQYGRLNPGGKVAVRLNPGHGAGHHQKVITAGKKTKFGIDVEMLHEVKTILARYSLKLVGVNQHIGSLFLEKEQYLKSVDSLLECAKEFSDLEFVDFGGGFGIAYHKENQIQRLDLADLGKSLDEIMYRFVKEYGKEITFRAEPGRYVTAESSVLLGIVNTVKTNHGKKYIGTDIGFNVLMRPVLYDSYHEIEVYEKNRKVSGKRETVTVVGNICESGDILAKDRELPHIEEKDVIGVLDAGAYGHVMSSNYNGRLRPAEVLVRTDGKIRLIRKRDTLEDLVKNYVLLP